MYTKERLQSEEFIKIYEHIAKNSLKDLNFVEDLLSKRKKKRDFRVKLNNKSFEANNNIMHFTNKIKNKEDGKYIDIDISKIIGDKKLLVNLVLGIEGFDISSGERYDRQQANVKYIYKDKEVNLLDIKTEEEIDQKEETRLKQYSKIRRR